MALVSTGYWLTVGIADAGAQVSTLEFQMTAPDAATAATDAATILAATNAVTDGVVVGYSIQERFEEDALVYPSGGEEIQNKASLTILLSGGSKRANRKIPAPTIGIFTDISGPGRNVVDVSDAAILAWVALFETGNEALLSDGEVADRLLAGKRVHAKSNFG